MADLLIRTLRGGLNDSDSPASLPDDMVVVANNVEWRETTVAERRRGSLAIDGGPLGTHDRVTFLYRHVPTTEGADAQLWGLGVTGTSSYTLAYKSNTWNIVTPVDDIVVTTPAQYQLQAQALHGKLFIAFKSDVDRLHVFDGTTLRRTGLAEPDAPTANDTGSGSFANTRYYRVRLTEQDGNGATLRRSEPSEMLSFTPSGSGSGAVVTRPALVGEGETHWELEASLDSENWFRIATTAVGTSTVTDSQPYDNGYSDIGTVSETIGDYSLIGSGRFLVVDEDRLLILSSFEDANAASRVRWTTVGNDPGDGNDERIPIATANELDLDGLEGGGLTGASQSIHGYVYAFKLGAIYKLVRTDVRQHAYEAMAITKSRGAVEGSIVDAVDEAGRPAVFFIDPTIGACLLGSNGLQTCGLDIRATWRRLNLDATAVSRGVYYPEAQQIHWWIAVDGADTPNLRVVLHINEMRLTPAGYRRGWAVWNGASANALAACLFAENVDDNEPRSLRLVPLIALEPVPVEEEPEPTGWVPDADIYTAFSLAHANNQSSITAINAPAGDSPMAAALADESDESFVQMRFNRLNASDILYTVVGLAPHTDPGVDTGHALHVRWRQRTPNLGSASAFLQLGTGWDPVNNQFANVFANSGAITLPLSNTFADYQMTLNATAVQAIRAANGYSSLQVMMFLFYTSIPTLESSPISVDVSRLYMEAP
jgi:hypothetical protein